MPFVQVSFRAVFLGLLLAATASTIVGTQGPAVSDETIARQVAVRLVDRNVTPVAVSIAGTAVATHGSRWIKGITPPVHVFVERGAVTLMGVVYSDVERRRAFSVARGTSGVVSVMNKLRVESAWDDEGEDEGADVMPPASGYADPDPNTMCVDR